MYRHQVLAKEPRTSCIRHASKCGWVTFLFESLKHGKRMMGQASSFSLEAVCKVARNHFSSQSLRHFEYSSHSLLLPRSGLAIEIINWLSLFPPSKESLLFAMLAKSFSTCIFLQSGCMPIGELSLIHCDTS